MNNTDKTDEENLIDKIIEQNEDNRDYYTGPRDIAKMLKLWNPNWNDWDNKNGQKRKFEGTGSKDNVA